jgi:hypothetical protein
MIYGTMGTKNKIKLFYQKQKQTPWPLFLKTNYTDQAAATCRRRYYQFLWIEEVLVVSATVPSGH